MLAGLKGTRTPMYWTLDEKTRLAGCHMIREAVERVVLEEGIDTYKGFIREVIEDGRRAFRSRLREMAVPGRYRAPAFTELMFGKEEQLPSYARKDTLMRAGRAADHARGHAGARLRGRVGVGLPLGQLHAVLDAGRALGAAHPDADLQRQGQRRRLPRPALQLPARHVVEPLEPAGLDRQRLVLPDPVLHRLRQVALARALQARGFVEEVLAPYALTANAFQGGGIDQYGRQSATTNFGLSCVGGGAKMVLDGLDYAAAMWNPEGDMGDMEMWELIEPFLYLSQRVKPNTAGPGRHPRRLGLRVPAPGVEDAVLRDAEHRARPRVHPVGAVGRLPGRDGLPPQRARRRPAAKAERGEPFPLHEPDPADSALLREIAGEHLFDIETTTLPEVYKRGRPLPVHVPRREGLGDPLERPTSSVMEDIEGRLPAAALRGVVYGVVPGDARATAHGARSARRRVAESRAGARVDGGERQRILDRDMIEPVQRMYAESMRLSERWAREFREFWDLPEDFEFDVPTPEVDLASRFRRPRMKLDNATLRDLVDEKLPRGQVRAIQSGYKDRDRFDKYVAILQERVPWDDRIVLPFGEHLYIAKGGPGLLGSSATAVTSSASTTENWKLEALINVRDTVESLREIYPDKMHGDPEWNPLREYFCPGLQDAARGRGCAARLPGRARLPARPRGLLRGLAGPPAALRSIAVDAGYWAYSALDLSHRVADRLTRQATRAMSQAPRAARRTWTGRPTPSLAPMRGGWRP